MKVLVIDDEILIINLLTLLLKKEGYEVVSALNEDEALKKFDSNIDLLIIDKNLKGTSGLKLAGKLKAKNNFIRIILMTGEFPSERIYTDIDYTLYKPFQNEELINLINFIKDNKINTISKICHKLNQSAMIILGTSELLSIKYKDDKKIQLLKEQSGKLANTLKELSMVIFDN